MNEIKIPGVRSFKEAQAERDAKNPEGKKFRDSITPEDDKAFDKGGVKAVWKLRKKNNRWYPEEWDTEFAEDKK